jgi:hypothetical protein
MNETWLFLSASTLSSRTVDGSEAALPAIRRPDFSGVSARHSRLDAQNNSATDEGEHCRALQTTSVTVMNSKGGTEKGVKT